jgi:hypothetical protein
MAITIRSLLTSGPVWVPLTTGSSVRLSPGQTSGELPDVVMAGNAQADRLRELGVIDVETVTEAAEDAPPAAEPAAATEPVRARKRPDSAG